MTTVQWDSSWRKYLVLFPSKTFRLLIQVGWIDGDEMSDEDKEEYEKRLRHFRKVEGELSLFSSSPVVLF